MTQVTDRVANWVDDRTRVSGAVARLRGRAFPGHWSGLLWQVTIHSFIVVALTGLFLMFFYDPSTTPVVYDGSYAPLHGVEMSRALESTLNLSYDIRGGLLIRQLHNWASSLMIAALIVHILSVFFTGAFRKPRELTWVLLFLLLFAGMAAGLTGLVLPDDLLSGSSLAVLNGVMQSIPVIGSWLSAFVFQGSYPTGAIATFYPLHLVILPLVMAGLIAAVVKLSSIHGPLQSAREARSEHAGADRVVRGRPPVVALARSGGLFFIVLGVLTAIAAAVTVNPVATYGPADPGNASAGGGAVWYLAFLDGAQRLVPPGWEFVWMERTWTLAILVPVGICTLFLLAAVVYPFIEGWITKDGREHHILDRPRNMPTRTAIGVAGIVFYGVLWAAAGSDVIALQFGLSGESVLITLQLAVILGPPAAFWLTKRICLGLQRKDRDIALHGFETGRIVRLPGGEYVEIHQPVPLAERQRLIGPEAPVPYMPRPDSRGRLHLQDRARGVLARWMYGDRLPAIPEQDRKELDGRPAD